MKTSTKLLIAGIVCGVVGFAAMLVTLWGALLIPPAVFLMFGALMAEVCEDKNSC